MLCCVQLLCTLICKHICETVLKYECWLGLYACNFNFLNFLCVFLLVYSFLYCFVFSARCNLYISHLCYDVSVSLSVRLSVTEVHWHIIANLSLQLIAVAVHAGAREGIKDGEFILNGK